MNTLSTIIVDDEPLALNLLRSYLARRSEIEIIAECQNGQQAIDKITQLKPDLVFLDIQMPRLDGFDVIKNLQADLMPMVVFVTAYDRYALAAFDVHAVDYLLKPLDEDLLKRAIDRCLKRQTEAATGIGQKQNLIGAMQHIAASSSQDTYQARKMNDAEQEEENANSSDSRAKLVIKDRGTINFLEQKDIDWIDAAGDYMCIHVDGETHIIRSTLKSLLNQLDPTLFQRIHRSTIVNLERVTRILPLPKSEYLLELSANEKVKVSRNYKQIVKQLIAKHGGDSQ